MLMNLSARFKFWLNSSNASITMGLTRRFEWCDGLYRLHKAAMPLATALELLAASYSDQRVRYFTFKIADKLREGYSLTEALRQWHHDFASAEMALLESGESAARLGTSLKAVTELQRQRLQTKRAITQALLYPVVTLILAMLVALFILLFVVPEFHSFYRELNRQPPYVTFVLISLSAKLRQLDWFNVVDCLIIAEFGLALSAFYRLYDRICQCLCRVPVIKEVVTHYWQVIILRSLSLSLQTGMELPQALQLLGNIFAHSPIGYQVTTMLQALQTGSSLTEALNDQSLFDSKITRLLIIGEASGELSSVIASAADYASHSFDSYMTQLRQWAEPVMVSIVGIMTGALLLALYLPLFKLGTTL